MIQVNLNLRAGRQDQSQKKGRQGNRLTVVANDQSAPADPGRLAAVMKYVIWVETVLAETAKDFHLMQECKDRVAELQSRLSPRAATVEPSRVSGPMEALISLRDRHRVHSRGARPLILIDFH